jgi:hypothetical protein
MSEKHLTADLKDTALVITCECGASVVVPASVKLGKEAYPHKACSICGRGLFTEGAAGQGAAQSLAAYLQLVTEAVPAKIRIRVTTPPPLPAVPAS